jgi:hypothetical protein
VKQRIANCPACGAPIEFQLSTALVTVCGFCHSVVARTDKKLEDLGKVADLFETNSPVKKGMTGTFEKKSFDVVGRVQYQHPAGGVWDEFYLKFPGDRVRWLAYAQGKFYLTTEKRLTDTSLIPDFESMTPGHRLNLPDGKTLVVAESGTATARSADGDIPWAFHPNAAHRFVDLHGADREFATLEYDADGPHLFLGSEIAVDDLKLTGDSWQFEQPPSTKVGVLQLSCPQCGSPLTLHAPDETLRVCCPSCKSLLDCQQGKLEYLQTLTMKQGEKPLIPLGAVGHLNGIEVTVIGYLVRYVVYDGKKYRWSEYLLHNPKIGFRWLVLSSGHWSFVEAIPVSSVVEQGNVAVYEGETFKLFDVGAAFVQYVAGEFYWRVTIEEQVTSTDFIAPPRMISYETSVNDAGSELNISLGTYLPKEAVEEAFGVKDLPTPWGVGAIQPAPPPPKDIYIMWGVFVVILIGLNVMFLSKLVTTPVSQFHFYVALVILSLWPLLTMLGRRQFEVERWKQSDFNPYQGSGE